MKHKPFEAWVLSAERLDPRQEADLAAHLKACADCRGLRDALQRAESVLRAAPMALPSPGFRSRWSVLHAREVVRGKRASGWRLLAAAMLAVAVAIFGIGLVFVLAGGSPTVLFAGVLQDAVRWILWTRTFGEIGQTIIRNLPLVTASGVVLSLTALVAATGLTAVVWLLSIRRFSLRGVWQ